MRPVLASAFAQTVPDRQTSWFSASPAESHNRRPVEPTELINKIVSGLSQINSHTFCIKQSIMDDINTYAAEFTGHEQAPLELILRELNDTCSRLIESSEVSIRRVREWNDRADKAIEKATTFFTEFDVANEGGESGNGLERRIERAVEKRVEAAKLKDAELQLKYEVKREQFESEFALRLTTLLKQYADLDSELENQLITIGDQTGLD